MTVFKTAFLDSSISPLSIQILFLYITLALTGLITILHHSSLKRRYGDARGMWLYFSLFFSLLVVVPVLLLVLLEPGPLKVLNDLGVGPGNYRLGVLLMLIGLPITLLISHFISQRSDLKQWYPFSKEVCSRDRSFIAYELGYLLLYYTAWEFLYRGVLFFPLLAGLGFLPAMAITTSLSTLHHIGHPKSEIVGVVIGGIIFSAVALLTRSILYPIAIHAMVGLSTDIFIYLRNYRSR